MAPRKTRLGSVYCAEEDFITSPRTACQNRPVPSNKGKLALYSDPNLSAGKTLQCPQANKCSSVCLSQTFRSPLECQQYYPPTPPPPPPVPHPRRRHGRCASHQISGCQGVGDVSCHWNAKAAEKNIGGDRWCEKANIRLDRGAAAQSGRQKSFCLDKPGKPNADELVRKGLATWDIQSVSRRTPCAVGQKRHI